VEIEMTDDEKLAAMSAHANSLGRSPETHAEYVEKLSEWNSEKRPVDKTSLTYWFPLIEKAGLPVPKTEIFTMPLEAQAYIWMAFDCRGKGEKPPIEPFYDELSAAVQRLGLPCFLRTSQTSAKHQWKRTCYLDSIDKLKQHVFEIAEFSVCADMMGLDWSTWVVREMLPTIPYGICPHYNDFPVCKEFRFFVDDGKVRCFHPYWPLDSLEDGGWEPDAPIDVAYADLCSTGGAEEELRTLAEKAGEAVGGSWSVDILETEKGWYVTDMAEAHKSFHWEGCGKKGSDA
jgi:hypothetical protein